jgi:hypothetical protein
MANHAVMTAVGSFGDIKAARGNVRSSLKSGHSSEIAACLRCADFVAEVGGFSRLGLQT